MKELIITLALLLLPLVAHAQEGENRPIQEKVVQLMSDIEGGIIDVAPRAAELAIRANLWYSVSNLFVGIMYLIVALLALRWVWPVFRWAQSLDNDFEIFGWIASAFLGIVGIIFIVLGFDFILSPVDWVAIFDPEAGLALRLVDAFTS